MPESMKNRGLYDVGTRVHIAQDKFKKSIGTVVGYSECGEKMQVHWDNDFIHYSSCRTVAERSEICSCGTSMARIGGEFMPCELKEIR